MTKRNNGSYCASGFGSNCATVTVQTAPRFRCKQCQGSGSNGARDPVQTVPQFRYRRCHHSGANGATIPVQTVPRYRFKLCHGYGSKHHNFGHENFLCKKTEILYLAWWFDPPSKSLSRMSRKVQDWFLGDKGGAIDQSYSRRRHLTRIIIWKNRL